MVAKPDLAGDKWLRMELSLSEAMMDDGRKKCWNKRG
jgi:hypothetical protein